MISRVTQTPPTQTPPLIDGSALNLFQKDESGSGPPSNSGSVISTPAAIPARKDPNEEFFMMTFLSYKLNHQEYEKLLAVKSNIIAFLD